MLVEATTIMLRGAITVRMLQRYRRSRLPAQIVMAMLEDVWTEVDMSQQPVLSTALQDLTTNAEQTEVQTNG